MTITSTDIKKLKTVFVSKKDLKVALSNYPTKADLRNELSFYTTKVDLAELRDDLMIKLDEILGILLRHDEEFKLTRDRVYYDHKPRLDDHEKRISKLEQASV
jgi:hypothetical protein